MIQHQPHFARVLVELRGEAQLVAATLQTFRVELAERAFRRRARRLVVFPADEMAG